MTLPKNNTILLQGSSLSFHVVSHELYFCPHSTCGSSTVKLIHLSFTCSSATSQVVAACDLLIYLRESFTCSPRLHGADCVFFCANSSRCISSRTFLFTQYSAADALSLSASMRTSSEDTRFSRLRCCFNSAAQK